MNAKYAFALILALQVSMSLCEIQQPSQELVDKYETLKSTFYKRILNAYGRLQAAAAPLVEQVGQNEQGQAVRDYVDTLQAKPELQAIAKLVAGVGQEAVPLVDKARTNILGVYEQYLRPSIGQSLDDAINNIKVYLDQYMPAE